jgi:hypothetical protein
MLITNFIKNHLFIGDLGQLNLLERPQRRLFGKRPLKPFIMERHPLRILISGTEKGSPYSKITRTHFLNVGG